VSEADLAIMRRIDRLHLEHPFAGARMLKGLLAVGASSSRKIAWASSFVAIISCF
jgi:hypothetical protein